MSKIEIHETIDSPWGPLHCVASAEQRVIATVVATPDPHAAAKERARLWGARLIRADAGRFVFFTDKAFTILDRWDTRSSSLGKSDEECASLFSGSYTTEADAWSNFPAAPPPGWEAAKPRTEADRLAVVAFDEDSRDAGEIWARQDESTKQAYRNIAHAVSKADRASQLEPSEEEVAKARRAFDNKDCESDKPMEDQEHLETCIRAALIAAARVRLEKAEGEKS